MKLKMYFLLLALGALTLAFQSCDDDDNDGISVPAELQNALAEKHGNAQRIEWETKGTYYVADFYEDNYEKEAWFTKDGVWQMTETDIPGLAALPAVVKSAFESGRYASWHVDDIDKLERKDVETVYVIEVEQGKQEMDLYYSESGIFIKEVADTDGGHNSEGYLPSDLSAAVRTFINENYPDARIVEMDVEKEMTEVDIIHENKAKELLFTPDGTWVSTFWDVRTSDLPGAVTAAVQARYPDYVIDDADYVETKENDYYWVEAERGEEEVHVKVTAEGVIL